MARHDGYWILNGKVPEFTSDVMRWARAFENSEARRVAQTTLEDGIWVSTVFLGIDHGWNEGRPILFETMVFGPPEDTELFGRVRKSRPDLFGIQHRYSTWDEAVAGHLSVVAQVQGYIDAAKTMSEQLTKIAGTE